MSHDPRDDEDCPSHGHSFSTKQMVSNRLLNEADGEQPPGIYTIETEEESLDGHSVSAFRRVSTTLSRYDLKAKGRFIRFLEVTPEEIAAAQARSGLPPG